jgi:hypothetical protein
MSINCKRCDLPITFDNGRCLSASTGIPHDIRRCHTKAGYVYCPKCQKSYPKTSACEHYLTYGWKFNHNEQFVYNLILESYMKGDWFQRKNKRKTSHDKMKEGQKCKLCGLVFPKNAKRSDMDTHEEKCKLQSKLFA